MGHSVCNFMGVAACGGFFGDGAWAGPGGHWSVGGYPADGTATLLDGYWHHLTLVRRFVGGDGAQLELWIDGGLVDVELTPVRTDMQSYWSTWSGFRSGQGGWFFGAEKQAAIGVLSQYEDFKGSIGEMRFWEQGQNRPRGCLELE